MSSLDKDESNMSPSLSQGVDRAGIGLTWSTKDQNYLESTADSKGIQTSHLAAVSQSILLQKDGLSPQHSAGIITSKDTLSIDSHRSMQQTSIRIRPQQLHRCIFVPYILLSALCIGIAVTFMAMIGQTTAVNNTHLQVMSAITQTSKVFISGKDFIVAVVLADRSANNNLGNLTDFCEKGSCTFSKGQKSLEFSACNVSLMSEIRSGISDSSHCLMVPFGILLDYPGLNRPQHLDVLTMSFGNACNERFKCYVNGTAWHRSLNLLTDTLAKYELQLLLVTLEPDGNMLKPRLNQISSSNYNNGNTFGNKIVIFLHPATFSGVSKPSYAQLNDQLYYTGKKYVSSVARTDLKYMESKLSFTLAISALEYYGWIKPILNAYWLQIVSAICLGYLLIVLIHYLFGCCLKASKRVHPIGSREFSESNLMAQNTKHYKIYDKLDLFSQTLSFKLQRSNWLSSSFVIATLLLITILLTYYVGLPYGLIDRRNISTSYSHQTPDRFELTITRDSLIMFQSRQIDAQIFQTNQANRVAQFGMWEQCDGKRRQLEWESANWDQLIENGVSFGDLVPKYMISLKQGSKISFDYDRQCQFVMTLQPINNVTAFIQWLASINLYLYTPIKSYDPRQDKLKSTVLLLLLMDVFPQQLLNSGSNFSGTIKERLQLFPATVEYHNPNDLQLDQSNVKTVNYVQINEHTLPSTVQVIPSADNLKYQLRMGLTSDYKTIIVRQLNALELLELFGQMALLLQLVLQFITLLKYCLMLIFIDRLVEKRIAEYQKSSQVKPPFRPNDQPSIMKQPILINQLNRTQVLSGDTMNLQPSHCLSDDALDLCNAQPNIVNSVRSLTIRDGSTRTNLARQSQVGSRERRSSFEAIQQQRNRFQPLIEAIQLFVTPNYLLLDNRWKIGSKWGLFCTMVFFLSLVGLLLVFMVSPTQTSIILESQNSFDVEQFNVTFNQDAVFGIAFVNKQTGLYLNITENIDSLFKIDVQINSTMDDTLGNRIVSISNSFSMEPCQQSQASQWLGRRQSISYYHKLFTYAYCLPSAFRVQFKQARTLAGQLTDLKINIVDSDIDGSFINMYKIVYVTSNQMVGLARQYSLQALQVDMVQQLGDAYSGPVGRYYTFTPAILVRIDDTVDKFLTRESLGRQDVLYPSIRQHPTHTISLSLGDKTIKYVQTRPSLFKKIISFFAIAFFLLFVCKLVADFFIQPIDRSVRDQAGYQLNVINILAQRKIQQQNDNRLIHRGDLKQQK